MIPVFKPLFSGNEKKYLNNCIKDKWISSNGKYNFRLEKSFSNLVSRKYSSAISNGTVALEIALKALNLPVGSEVIVPTFTIISPVLAILRNNLQPVFVDMEKKYLTMSVDEIEKKITKNTKAIIVVHIYGFPCDMEKILKIKNKYKLKLIEDASEMHGQKYYNKPCGSFGDISTFSFYSNKFISSGEGGIVTTDSKYLKDRIDRLRNLSFGRKNRFLHEELGYNFRMSNIQAAIGYAQLGNLKKIVKKKREIGKLYNFLFKKNNLIETMPYKCVYSKNIYWVYGILVKNNKKKRLVEFLNKQNIQTRDYFVCMHNHM